MSIIFVSAPFDSVDRPHLALSQLRSVLKSNGAHCELRYANIDFAREIGIDNYRQIAERFPPAMLLGEAVFSQSAFEKAVDWDKLIDEADVQDADLPEEDRLSLKLQLPKIASLATAWIDRYAKETFWKSALIVGFSLTFSVVPGLALARAIKKNWPDVKIVLGGSLCDGALAEPLLRDFPWIDYVAKGEGEYTITMLAEAMMGKVDQVNLGKVPGLCTREKDGSISLSSVRGRSPNLTKLPQPDFQDWHVVRHSLKSDDPERIAFPVETSRGCWFGQKSHCTFCGLNGEGMNFREKSADVAFEQIQNLGSKGVQRIFCVDNIMPHRYFSSLLPALSKVDGPELFYEVKSNLTRKQCEALKEANVLSVQPGIESFSTHVLKIMRKGTTSFLNVRLLRYASEIGLNVHWNMLYGFPGENPLDYSEQAELAPKLIHLQPPTGTGSTVRLDRFSPLYFEADELGVHNIQPARAYDLIYPTNIEDLSQHAVFFEYEGCYNGNPHDYYKPLKTAISEWKKRTGDAVCVALDDGQHIHVFDSRYSHGGTTFTLEGLEAEIYRICLDGLPKVKAKALISTSANEVLSVDDAISSLVSQNLVVELDDQYLALPTTKKVEDYPGIERLPFSMRVSFLAAASRQAMVALTENQMRSLKRSPLQASKVSTPPLASEVLR